DPARVMVGAGIDPGVLRNPENALSFQSSHQAETCSCRPLADEEPEVPAACRVDTGLKKPAGFDDDAERADAEGGDP
ncbi:MAG: hypothetical protein ACREF3_00855, partial [Acetobacteraceae bacterium]